MEKESIKYAGELRGTERPIDIFLSTQNHNEARLKRLLVDKMFNKEDLIEKLAEIEHDQWEQWSRSLAVNEVISPARLGRWKTLWVPYSMLTEEQKEQDRAYARKVIEVLLG